MDMARFSRRWRPHRYVGEASTLIDGEANPMAAKDETEPTSPGAPVAHGQICYLQIPVLDVMMSAAFYERSSAGKSSDRIQVLKRPV
jgi:hypothetical protein